MKTTCLLLLIACLAMAFAAPAPAPEPKPDSQAPSVNLLRYSNDQELEAIQRQIIAQYEKLGGTSQFHQVQGISYVDPNRLNIHTV